MKSTRLLFILALLLCASIALAGQILAQPTPPSNDGIEIVMPTNTEKK
jgi:hypothetical protein